MFEPNELGVVVCVVGIPVSRIQQWCDWNRRVLAGVGRVSYVTMESCAADPCWVYSPSVAANVGIRECVDNGLQVILKTDVDCVLSREFVEACVAVGPEEVLSPHIAQVAAPGAAGQVFRDWCGTVAMRTENWVELCGYDERMFGHGREDGDLLRRAKLKHMDVVRCHRIEHVSHPSRIGPRYPRRPLENRELGRVPWANENWGMAAK